MAPNIKSKHRSENENDFDAVSNGMIALDYLSWHYSVGLNRVLKRSFLAMGGIANFFSIIPLATTLFSPWHGIIDPYSSATAFRIGDFFWVLVSNLISRILGAMVRSAVVVAGTITFAATVMLRALFVVLWLLLPIAIPALFIAGVILVFA